MRFAETISGGCEELERVSEALFEHATLAIAAADRVAENKCAV